VPKDDPVHVYEVPLPHDPSGLTERSGVSVLEPPDGLWEFWGARSSIRLPGRARAAGRARRAIVHFMMMDDD
jgi:hypothetical protein